MQSNSVFWKFPVACMEQWAVFHPLGLTKCSVSTHRRNLSRLPEVCDVCFMFWHVVAGGGVILMCRNQEQQWTTLYRVPSHQTGLIYHHPHNTSCSAGWGWGVGCRITTGQTMCTKIHTRWWLICVELAFYTYGECFLNVPITLEQLKSSHFNNNQKMNGKEGIISKRNLYLWTVGWNRKEQNKKKKMKEKKLRMKKKMMVKEEAVDEDDYDKIKDDDNI